MISEASALAVRHQAVVWKEKVAVCQSSGCVIRPALTAVVPRWMRADHPLHPLIHAMNDGALEKMAFLASMHHGLPGRVG